MYSTFKDREENLWFGTAGGLDRIRENKATPFSSREGLVPDDQIAVTSTPDGSVWFASYTGDIVQRFRSGRFVSYKLPPSPPSKPDRILSLDADGENHVWVGGPFKLDRENDGKFSFSKVSDVDQVHDVHAITHDAGGNLWVTVWDDDGGGVLRLRGGKWTDFPSQVHLPISVPGLYEILKVGSGRDSRMEKSRSMKTKGSGFTLEGWLASWQSIHNSQRPSRAYLDRRRSRVKSLRSWTLRDSHEG